MPELPGLKIGSTVNRSSVLGIVVGALNGTILPLSLRVILIGARSRKIVGDYRHPI